MPRPPPPRPPPTRLRPRRTKYAETVPSVVPRRWSLRDRPDVHGPAVLELDPEPRPDAPAVHEDEGAVGRLVGPRRLAVFRVARVVGRPAEALVHLRRGQPQQVLLAHVRPGRRVPPGGRQNHGEDEGRIQPLARLHKSRRAGETARSKATYGTADAAAASVNSFRRMGAWYRAPPAAR